MKSVLNSILGPRVPESELTAHRGKYVLPTLCMGLAGLLLLISIVTPYWHMTLHAPQYPKGLTVDAYVNRLEGDVREIDGLNHYIGMRPLGEAAQLERELSIIAIATLALLLAATVFIHSKWAALAALPTVFYPVLFLGDLYYWMNDFGQNLDPKAALSSSIKPFTPPVLGEGFVGQFRTVATPGVGLILAACATVIVVAGLWFHRRAYKPLIDRSLGTP